MNTKVHFSSKDMTYATPQDLFDKLNSVFNFTLDPCAEPSTAKCSTYYTEQDDGLTKSWAGHSVFTNPPYGVNLKHWVKKCYEESLKVNTNVVVLMPARTDTSYQHEYVYGKAIAICLMKGRIKFGNSKSSAPFPSQLVVYSNRLTQDQLKVLESLGYVVK